VVDADGLGDLEEPDQLETVEALGAGLVAVDLGESGVDGWVGDDQTVDVREPEEPADRVHHRVDRGGHQAALAEVADVQLDVGSLDPDQRVKTPPFTPGEPAAELVGVQRVGVSGVPGEVGDGSELGWRHLVGLERKQDCCGHGGTLAMEVKAHATDRRTRGEALSPTLRFAAGARRIAGERRAPRRSLIEWTAGLDRMVETVTLRCDPRGRTRLDRSSRSTHPRCRAGGMGGPCEEAP